MMITLIMVFTSLAVFPMQVSATAGVPVSSLVSGKTYFIRNYRSGLYMDVTGAGGVGTQVIQWSLNQYTCQQWRLTYYSGGYYSLSPAHLSSTNYLNQYTASTATGNHIKIWDTGGAPDSYSSWYIYYQGTDGQGNSLFSIRTQLASQQAAVIEGGSYAAEAHVILWPYSGTTNELWYFEEVPMDDHGNDMSNATELNTSVSYVDMPYSGTMHTTLNPMEFGEYGEIEQAYDVDFFEFVPEYTSRYTFYTASGFDTMGYLYDSSGSVIASNDDYQGGTDFRITPSDNLIAGQTYYIKVQAYSNGTGDYALRFLNVYADMEWAYPLADGTNNTKISDAYREGSLPHGGLDIVGPTGGSIENATLYAVRDGKVARKGIDYYGGNFIGVRTNDRDPYNNDYLEYIYEHMHDETSYNVGNDIYVGNPLGAVGATGYNCTGAHLHFQINTNACGLSGYRDEGYGNLDENTTNPRKFYDHYRRFYSRTDQTGNLNIYPSSYNGLEYSQW